MGESRPKMLIFIGFNRFFGVQQNVRQCPASGRRHRAARPCGGFWTLSLTTCRTLSSESLLGKKTPEKAREKSGKNQGKIREKSMGVLGEMGKVVSRAVF